MTREMIRDLMIDLAKEAAAGPNRPTYNTDDETFEPHAWVLDAMALAYAYGRAWPGEPLPAYTRPVPTELPGPGECA